MLNVQLKPLFKNAKKMCTKMMTEIVVLAYVLQQLTKHIACKDFHLLLETFITSLNGKTENACNLTKIEGYNFIFNHRLP